MYNNKSYLSSMRTVFVYVGVKLVVYGSSSKVGLVAKKRKCFFKHKIQWYC